MSLAPLSLFFLPSLHREIIRFKLIARLFDLNREEEKSPGIVGNDCR